MCGSGTTLVEARGVGPRRDIWVRYEPAVGVREPHLSNVKFSEINAEYLPSKPLMLLLTPWMAQIVQLTKSLSQLSSRPIRPIYKNGLRLPFWRT